MIVQTVQIPQALRLTATPLTRETFSPFGDVLTNPSPTQLPHNTPPASIAAGALPCGAISANQGSAIQYKQLGSVRNLYDGGQAPSQRAATPRVTMFVCGARQLRGGDEFDVEILERHPFTTQTFVPLTRTGARTRYLVIVAPTLATGSGSEAGSVEPLPVPTEAMDGKGALPGRGMPDLGRLRAFLATGEQAVTYGAGTWHAPMVALGEKGTAVDFVVTQFANDVAVEDCQEVVLECADQPTNNGITVKVPGQFTLAKL